MCHGSHRLTSSIAQSKVLPDAHREGDAVAFKRDVYATPEVQAVIAETRERVKAWWATIATDDKLGLIFASVLLGKKKSINYDRFQEACRKVAMEKELTFQALIQTATGGEVAVEEVQMAPEPCLELANGLVSKALDHDREVTAGAIFHLDVWVRVS